MSLAVAEEAAPLAFLGERIIEADLRAFVSDRLELPHERLTWECEQAVRSYDPCISCAAHFLDLRVQRA